MSRPLVSVILPVYNGERLLAESIRSVLRQDYRPVELIIVDDGSVDATARVAAGFSDSVRYFHQSHAGPAAARNLGLRVAQGEYIAFIDADDLWPERKLRFQMNCFEAFPKVEIVQGLIRRIKLQGMVRWRIIGPDLDFPFVYSNLGSILVRRRVFKEIGVFDESLPFHEDTDFWLRAREAGIHILVQRKVSLIYRIHGQNLTTGENLKTVGFLNILRRSIVRRRNLAGVVREVGKLSFLPDDRKGTSRTSQLRAWDGEPLPPVSVVLSVSRQSVNPDRALESIRKQEYHPLELWIVGPRLDQVRQSMAESFDRAEWIEQEQEGLASQLNLAIEKSTGVFVAFLEGDGEWPPGKLKAQARYLLEHVEEEYLVGRTRHILQPEEKYPSELIDSLSLRKSLGDLLGTLIVRRSFFERVGGFKAGLQGMEETDWLLRAQDLGFPKRMLPEVCLYRFARSNSSLAGAEQMKSALLDSLRASVHRKRTVGTHRDRLENQ